MTEQEWDRFFELLERIVDLPMPVEEKRRLVEQEAAERGDDLNLDEFVSWFDK